MNEHGYSINNDDEGSVMMDLIIIQKWRRNMKYQMNKQVSLRMNDMIVQSVFSEIACLELMGLINQKETISEFVECAKKGGLIHLFHNKSHCSTWHGCSVVGSFPSLKQLLKPNDEYDSGMIYHSVCIIVTERVWMNTTLVFNQCVCLKCVKKTYQSHWFIWYNKVLFMRMGQQ